MASWSKTTKHEPSSINGGQRYKKGDRVSREQLNTITENSFYAVNKSDVANTKSDEALFKANQAYSGAGANPNLLINGDFSINQRGQTEYQGNEVYSVDRWQCGGNTKFNVETKTISFYTKNKAFVQKFEDWGRYAGKTVTISAKVNSITPNADIRLLLHDDTGNKTKQITSTGIVSYTYTIIDALTKFRAGFIYGGATTTTAQQIQVEWVKLEIGSVATVFSPRPYAEELAICQRYYQKIIGMRVSCCLLQSKTIDFMLPLVVTMRTGPSTITLGEFEIQTISGTPVEGFETATFGAGLTNLKIRATKNNHGITNNASFTQLGFSPITLDAEIY